MVILPPIHLGQYLREVDMSKGSKARPFSVSQREFDNRWDTIFRKSPQEVQDAVREDEEFNRIDTMQVRVKEDKDKVGQCGCDVAANILVTHSRQKMCAHCVMMGSDIGSMQMGHSCSSSSCAIKSS